MDKSNKIAFGGGCHWCTEAVFQSLLGVKKVAHGFVASLNENNSFSEAVIVFFNPKIISLDILIEIHLHTHKSTSQHAMRKKYRSALYTYSKDQKIKTAQIIKHLQSNFNKKIITKILDFKEFKPSLVQHQNYYYSNPEKPFCKKFINPKFQFLLSHFSKQINLEKLHS